MTTLWEAQLAELLPPEESQQALQNNRQSWLLNYLPAMYAGDDFLERFLFIFEDTLKPLMQMVSNFHYYFNPLTAPPDLIPWLANWVNLVLDENWSMEQRRNLIHSAADLYSRRGTRRGLIEYLKLYTGTEPEISEYSDGMTLGPETFLGVNTTIAGRERHSFTVIVRLDGLSEAELSFKEANIRRIIEAEKPAHTTYRLKILTGSEPDRNSAPQSDTTPFAAPEVTNGHSPAEESLLKDESSTNGYEYAGQPDEVVSQLEENGNQSDPENIATEREAGE
ncbi:MAG TPA: phage tail protein [Chloroflexia bacterium]|nr:phage tail protein [Chloroflexia bacterium]